MRDRESVLCPSQAWHVPPARSWKAWPVLIALLALSATTLSRPASAASGLGRAPGSSLILKNTSETFPVTPVGQTASVCTNVCFCSDVNNCTCDQSGTIVLNHDLSAPFSAYGYTLESVDVADDCSGGTPTQLPVFLNAGTKLVYSVAFSPTSVGTFSDYLQLTNYIFSVSGSTPSGAVTPGQAGVLYAVSDTGNNQSVLYTISDFSTNPRISVIGDTGLNFPAIAINPLSGIIYAIDDDSGFLFQLDAQSGASTFIGSTGLAAAGPVALACDGQGRLFTWGQNDGVLYQLDSSSGAASAIGQTGYLAGGDLAFDPNGTLYGSTGTDLITINPGSGASTYIGSFQTGNIFGLAAAADGTLYAGQATSGSTGQLYRVTKSNGQLTPVGGALTESIADLALFGGSVPRGSASLEPYTPSGWSAPVVVSNTPGTQVDSRTLKSTDKLYASWALENSGDLSTFGTFYIDLNLDGAALQRWHYDQPLPPGYYISIKDYPFGQLGSGVHTLELVPDPTHVIGASSTTYTKTITVSSAAPGSLSLLFPLKASTPNRRHLGPYTASIITVFDHSMADAKHRFSPYGCDLAVVAFTGERGDKKPSPSGSACADHPGYSQSNGQPFAINGHYTGSRPDGPDYLNYEGHPGFDYAARVGTQVFAAAGGTVHYPITPGALQLSDPYKKYHVLEIIPDADPSYRLYYLHLSTHPSAPNTQGNYSDPSPAPGCPAQVDLPLPEGAHVDSGCLIALSGIAGAPHGAHLHFEVRKVLTVPGGGIAASSPMRCRADQALDDSSHACIPVDPYRWIGSYPDPYIALTGVASTGLWADPRP